MRQLGLRNRAWCEREFAATRFDAKFCCRECLDKWFIRERREALAHWREMQRRPSLFLPSTINEVTRIDDENERRRA